MNSTIRDLISRKRRRLTDYSSSRIENACRRIVDCVGNTRKIAAAPGCKWSRNRQCERLAFAQPLPVEEKEQSIPAVEAWQFHRPIDRQPILVALERWNRGGRTVEVVLRVESGVAHKLEKCPVILVCPGFRRDVYLRDRSPVLGVEKAGLDLELPDRVDRRQEHITVEVQVSVLDPVE